MPLVSTCSAAISANCHPPKADKQAHLLPLQWGVIEASAYANSDDRGKEYAFKRCVLTTSRDVRQPRLGDWFGTEHE